MSLPNDIHCLPNLERFEIDGYPELCRKSQLDVGESSRTHTMALMNQMKYRNWNNCMISQGWNLFLFFSFSPFNNVLSFCLMFCSVRLDHWTSITSLLERRRGQLNKKCAVQDSKIISKSISCTVMDFSQICVVLVAIMHVICSVFLLNLACIVCKVNSKIRCMKNLSASSSVTFTNQLICD
jgi:hypothetical protein